MNPARGVVSWSQSPTTAYGESLSLSDNWQLTHSSAARSELAQLLQLFCNVQHSRKLLEAEWVVLSAWATGTEPCSSLESDLNSIPVTCVQPWSSTSAYCRIFLATTTRTKCGNGERSFPVCLILSRENMSDRWNVNWQQCLDLSQPDAQWANSNVKLITHQSHVSKD